MSLYAIADLHLSLGTNKSMEVFAGWNNYVEKIKKNWNSRVGSDDTVVIVGDISWAMSLKQAKLDFSFIDQLAGKKIIIKGNHDYWWSTKTKINDFFKENSFSTMSILLNSAVAVGEYGVCGTKGWIYDSKIKENDKVRKREVLRLRTSIEIAESMGKKPLVFLHYPPVYWDNEYSEVFDLLKEKKITECFYGHIHGKNSHSRAINGLYKGINLQLISCDYLNFTPYLVKKLL